MFILRTFTTLSLSCLVLGACSGSTLDVQPADANQGSTDGTGGSQGDNTLGTPDGGAPDGELRERWTLIQPCVDGAPSDPIDIKNADVDGSYLNLTVAHSSGCAEHSYGLCYEQAWAESEPVQIGIRLLHDAHGEMCEAYEVVSLQFDLTPLEDAYNEGYQSNGGTIDVGFGDHSFVHQFGDAVAPLLSWEEIDSRIEALNSCETVEDCQGLSTRPCETAYVNGSADLTDIESYIKARNIKDNGSDDFSCDASCACGSLTCKSGKCTTHAITNCEEPSEGKMVCL